MLMKRQYPIYTAYDKLVEQSRTRLAKAVAKVKDAYDQNHGTGLQPGILEHDRQKLVYKTGTL